MSTSIRRVMRSKTKEDQIVVDEILQVVADQGRKSTLSSTDYQFTKNISKRPDTRYSSENNNCCFVNSRSCTTLSNLSYTPPSTQESAYTSLSEGSGRDMLRKSHSMDMQDRHNGVRMPKLPPLNPRRINRPSRPAPPRQSPIHVNDALEGSGVKRPVRPKSAHGQRTVSNRHRVVSMN